MYCYLENSFKIMFRIIISKYNFHVNFFLTKILLFSSHNETKRPNK